MKPRKYIVFYADGWGQVYLASRHNKSAEAHKKKRQLQKQGFNQTAIFRLNKTGTRYRRLKR